MKYAVIRMGSNQYQVEEGKTVMLDLQKTEPGKEITFPEVILYVDGDDVKVGNPLVNGVKVIGQADAMVKGRKIVTGKFRKREGYRRAYGHRDIFTPVKITQIVAG